MVKHLFSIHEGPVSFPSITKERKLQSRIFIHICYGVSHGIQVSLVVRVNQHMILLNTAYTEIKRPEQE